MEEAWHYIPAYRLQIYLKTLATYLLRADQFVLVRRETLWHKVRAGRGGQPPWQAASIARGGPHGS